MKPIQLSFLAFAALGAAQFPALPDCAKPCASTLPPECNLEVGCICRNQDWISGISCCVKTKCSDADQQKTQQVAQQLCDTAKVTLPTAASCAASSGPTASSSTTMSSSSTAGAAGAVTTGMSTSSNGTATSGSSTSSTSQGSATGSAAGGASTGVSSATGSSSGSATGTSSAAARATSNAAAALQKLGSGIGAVGAAVAAFALL